jgi:hypothetical protein
MVDMRTCCAARDGARVVTAAEEGSMLVINPSKAPMKVALKSALLYVVGIWSVFRDKATEKSKFHR